MGGGGEFGRFRQDFGFWGGGGGGGGMSVVEERGG